MIRPLMAVTCEINQECMRPCVLAQLHQLTASQGQIGTEVPSSNHQALRAYQLMGKGQSVPDSGTDTVTVHADIPATVRLSTCAPHGAGGLMIKPELMVGTAQQRTALKHKPLTALQASY